MKYCWIVRAYWLVVGYDRSRFKREYISIQQCHSKILVSDLENKITLRFIWTLMDVTDLNLDKVENYISYSDQYL